MAYDLRNSNTLKSANRLPLRKASHTCMDTTRPFSASNEGSYCKENVITNKCEISKLNVEPLQMKRKKKGGRTNLRKSLVWDNAFFTEEGILDPQELSIINGASCKEFTVYGDDNIGGTQLRVEHLDMKKHESRPLKELRDDDLDGGGKKDSLPETTSSSSNMTTKKDTTQFGCMPGPRDVNCPQLLPSSALKRPATVKPGISASKDVKQLKIPRSKPGCSSVFAIRSSILEENCVKYNQIQPGVKISSQRIKITQNSSKSSSPRTISNPERNSVNSSIKNKCLANMSPLMGGQALEFARTTGASMIQAGPFSSSEVHHQLKNLKSSQNTSITGRIMDLVQNQTAKPSGLRMPSPSLSFFGQTKASVSNILSLRHTDNFHVCGSQKPGNLRLLETSGTKSELANNIVESQRDINTAIDVREQCLIPFSADAVSCETLSLKQTGSKHPKIECELPQLSKNSEFAILDKNLKEIINGCAGKSNLCGSGWESVELIAEQNNEIHESYVKDAVDALSIECNTCKSLVPDHDAEFERLPKETADYKGENPLIIQKSLNDTSKLHCHKPCKEKSDDELKYSFSDHLMIGENVNNMKQKERIDDLDELSQLDVAPPCDDLANSEALENKKPDVESVDFGSQQDAILTEDVFSVDGITSMVYSEEADIQDAAFTSTIHDCRIKIDQVAQACKVTPQSGEYLMVQIVCPRIDQDCLRNDESGTSDRMLQEKEIDNKRSLQEEIVGSNQLMTLESNDGSNVVEINMGTTQSTTEKSFCDFETVEVFESLKNTELNSLEKSLLFGMKATLLQKKLNCYNTNTCEANIAELHFPSRERMESELFSDGSQNRTDVKIDESQHETSPDILKQENQKMETSDYSRPHPKIKNHEKFQNKNDGKLSDMKLQIENVCQNSLVTSDLAQKGGFKIVIEGNMLMQSPESDILNDNSTEHLELPHVRSAEVICFSGNDVLLVGEPLQSKGIPSERTPSSCNDGDEGGYQSSSVFKLQPMSDIYNVASTFTPSKKCGNNCKERSQTSYFPQDVTPFSDEWLAAIEAAGEDILTRKGGAVQNSPPHESLIEPNPWSPVKKKYNHLGPFDCTKFHNISR